MKIGERIRIVRRAEKLKQKEFAERIRVSPSYISFLERNEKEPSERLIWNICQTFGVNYEWIKEGKGEKYGKLRVSAAQIVGEIYKKIESGARLVSLADLALILNIDPDIPGGSPNLPEQFYDALYMLIRLFLDGDQGKIDAVLAQLRALMPQWRRNLWIGEGVKEDRQNLLNREKQKYDFKDQTSSVEAIKKAEDE